MPKITDRELIDDIEAYGDGVTDWESNFISDIDKKVVSRGYGLSDKQRSLLETIHGNRVK